MCTAPYKPDPLDILCIRLKQLRVLSEMENRTSVPNVGRLLPVLCLAGTKSSLLLVLIKGSFFFNL